jgi:hypothetical protein
MFLVPMSVWGNNHVTYLPPELPGETGNDSNPPLDRSQAVETTRKNLATLDLIEKQLAEANKELENLEHGEKSVRTKADIEAEIKAIIEQSEVKRQEILKNKAEIDGLEGKIAKEDNDELKKLRDRLVKVEEDHKQQEELDRQNKERKKKLASNKGKKLPKEKIDKSLDSINKTKSAILDHLESGEKLSEQLITKYKQTLKELEQEENQLKHLEKQYYQTSAQEYAPYQPAESSVGEQKPKAEETPHSNGETTSEAQSSGSKENTGSAGGTSGSTSGSKNVSGSSSNLNLSRGASTEPTSNNNSAELTGLSQQSPTAERVDENTKKLERATSYLGTPGATQPETNAVSKFGNASGTANTLTVPPTTQAPQAVVQQTGGVKTPPSVVNNNYYGGRATSAGVSSSASTSASGSSGSEPQSNAVAPGSESTVTDTQGVRPLAKDSKKNRRTDLAYGTPTNAGTSNVESKDQNTYAQPTSTSGTQTETKALVFDKYGNFVPAASVAETQRKIASEEDPPRLDLTTPGSDPSIAKLSEQIAESPVIVTPNKEANKTGTDTAQPGPTLSAIDNFLVGLNLTSDSQLLNKNESPSGRGLLEEISSLGKKKPKSNNTPSLVTQAAASSAKPEGFFDGLKQAWTKLWN